MKRIVDLMAILTVLTIAGAWWMTRAPSALEEQIAQTRLAVDRMRAQVLLRSQSDREMLNETGWPPVIDPEWFGEDLPLNTLIEPDRVWLEIAAPEQAGWKHPRPLFTLEKTTAMFWYNPWLGIVRARVALQPTDAEMLAHYNEVNGTSLSSTDPRTFDDRETVKLTSVDVDVDAPEGE